MKGRNRTSSTQVSFVGGYLIDFCSPPRFFLFCCDASREYMFHRWTEGVRWEAALQLCI